MASCLHPHTIFNPHYKKFESELLSAETMPHDLWLTIPCGKCVHCRKARSSNWRVRIYQELRYKKYEYPVFVTLTFDEDSYRRFRDDPAVAMRRFLERYRKRFKRSCRHFFVTELGGDYGRLHLHGILFDCRIPCNRNTFARKPKKDGKYGAFVCNDGSLKEYVAQLKELWSYGNVWVDAVRAETSNYVVKYLLKEQEVEHYDELSDDEKAFVDSFRPRCYVSPGLGRDYCDDPKSLKFHYSKDDGVWYVPYENTTQKDALPRYYANKIFPEDFRKSLSWFRWIDPPNRKYYLNGITYHDKSSYDAAASQFYTESLARRTSIPVRKYYSSDRAGLAKYILWIRNAVRSGSDKMLDAIDRSIKQAFGPMCLMYNLVNLERRKNVCSAPIKIESPKSLQFRLVV